MTETRQTRVPVMRIRKLIKMKKDLDAEVKNIMEEFNVDMNYMRGIFKVPMNDTPTRKRKSKPPTSDPIIETPPEPVFATKPQKKPRKPRAKKESVDRSDLIG